MLQNATHQDGQAAQPPPIPGANGQKWAKTVSIKTRDPLSPATPNAKARTHSRPTNPNVRVGKWVKGSPLSPEGVQRHPSAEGTGVSPVFSGLFRTPFLARKGAGRWSKR